MAGQLQVRIPSRSWSQALWQVDHSGAQDAPQIAAIEMVKRLTSGSKTAKN